MHADVHAPNCMHLNPTRLRSHMDTSPYLHIGQAGAICCLLVYLDCKRPHSHHTCLSSTRIVALDSCVNLDSRPKYSTQLCLHLSGACNTAVSSCPTDAKDTEGSVASVAILERELGRHDVESR
jgi:hypothetical protein